MSHDWIEAVATAISAVLALIAVIISIVALRRQERLETKLAKQREDFDKGLAQTERLYSQRAALFDLWKYISELSEVSPRSPITPDILKAVNALELVALCCEGGIVDPDLVRRTFRNTYIHLYDQIDLVIQVPGLNKSGRKLLEENPAALKLYKEFKEEIMLQGQLKPIGA
ncbi:MAG: DUF4760 domain-containing protein [Pseudomonadota bacterium]